MNIIIDTNIVFSALISPDGTISDLIFNSKDEFTFFTPNTTIEELRNHREKLISISKLPLEKIIKLESAIFKRIEIIELDMVKEANWEKGMELTKNVDEYDAPFIALTLELEGLLWTGDKKLMKGLRSKNFQQILDTKEISFLRIQLE